MPCIINHNVYMNVHSLFNSEEIKLIFSLKEGESYGDNTDKEYFPSLVTSYEQNELKQ